MSTQLTGSLPASTDVTGLLAAASFHNVRSVVPRMRLDEPVSVTIYVTTESTRDLDIPGSERAAPQIDPNKALQLSSDAGAGITQRGQVDEESISPEDKDMQVAGRWSPLALMSSPSISAIDSSDDAVVGTPVIRFSPQPPDSPSPPDQDTVVMAVWKFQDQGFTVNTTPSAEASQFFILTQSPIPSTPSSLPLLVAEFPLPSSSSNAAPTTALAATLTAELTSQAPSPTQASPSTTSHSWTGEQTVGQPSIQTMSSVNPPPTILTFHPGSITTQAGNGASTMAILASQASSVASPTIPLANTGMKEAPGVPATTRMESTGHLTTDTGTATQTASGATPSKSTVESTTEAQTRLVNNDSSMSPVETQPSKPGDGVASTRPSTVSSPILHDNSGTKPPVVAIVGGVVSAMAAVTLLILALLSWTRKGDTNEPKPPMAPPGGAQHTEKRARENDRMERGFPESPLKKPGRMDFREMLRASSLNVFQYPTSIGRKAAPAAKESSNPQDFRVGMSLNLESLGDFSPFSDAHAATSEYMDTPADPHMMLALPIARSVLEDGLMGPQSLTEVFRERANKFHSDPFDLELDKCLITGAGSLTSLSQALGTSSASSRYSVAEGYTSRPSSGASFSNWADLGKNIRIAKLNTEDGYAADEGWAREEQVVVFVDDE